MKKTYNVTYRGELSTEVTAENEDTAVYLAERARNWEFMTGEGHKDLFEVIEIIQQA